MVYAGQAVASRGILVQHDDGLINCLFSDAPWLSQDLKFQHWLHDWLGSSSDAEFMLYIRRADGRDLQQYACDLGELISYTLPSVHAQFSQRREPLDMLYCVLPETAAQLGPAQSLQEGLALGAELQQDGAVWRLAVNAAQIDTHDVAAPLRLMDKVLVDWLKSPDSPRPWLRITHAENQAAIVPRPYLLKLATGAPWWLLLVHPDEYPAWFSALARGPEHDVQVGACLVDKEALMMAAHVALWEAEAGAISLLYDDVARNCILKGIAEGVTHFLRRCLAAGPVVPAGKPIDLAKITINQGAARMQVAFGLLSLAQTVLAQQGACSHGAPVCCCRQLPGGSLYVYLLHAEELLTQLIIPASGWSLPNTDATCEAWQPHRRLVATLDDIAAYIGQHDDETTKDIQDRYQLLCHELDILCRALLNNLVPGVTLGIMPTRVILLARECLSDAAIATGLGLPHAAVTELATWRGTKTGQAPYAAAYVPANQEKGWVRYAASLPELVDLLALVQPGDTEAPVVEAYGIPIEMSVLRVGATQPGLS